MGQIVNATISAHCVAVCSIFYIVATAHTNLANILYQYSREARSTVLWAEPFLFSELWILKYSGSSSNLTLI